VDDIQVISALWQIIGLEREGNRYIEDQSAGYEYE
jgi:hypothetical protein